MEQRMHFTQKLEELKKMVMGMAALTEKQVASAVQAFFDNDAELAEQVIDGDMSLNQEECNIDRYNLDLIALGQPVARDLRFIVGAMRITSNLERIGDEAVNLAQRTVFLSTRAPLPFDQLLEKLVEVCKKMLANAIVAFNNSDVAMANQVCNGDEEADDLHYKILKKMIGTMVNESRMVERGVHHIMASRHLERLADLSTNIAEAVIFIVEGEDIKHRCRG